MDAALGCTGAVGRQGQAARVRVSKAAQRATRQPLERHVDDTGWRVIARMCALVADSPLGLELAAV